MSQSQGTEFSVSRATGLVDADVFADTLTRIVARGRGRFRGDDSIGGVMGDVGLGNLQGLDETELMFDHERLDVYRCAREFVIVISAVLKRTVPRELRDQVDRSSMSILFNIAEGAGKTSHPEKQRFYEIARGSATEAAAQLDVLHLRGHMGTIEYRDARMLLIRTVQMLSRLAGGAKRI